MVNSFIFYMNLISSFFIAVIGIPGNLAILYFFLIKCWKRINSYYLFIIYLAFSDLAVCITRFVSVTVLYFAAETQTATLLCENTWFLATGISNVSIWILSGMYFDRYRKITKPLAKQLPKWYIHITFIITALAGYWASYPFQRSVRWNPLSKICKLGPGVSIETSITSFFFHLITLSILPISINIYSNFRITKYLNCEANSNDQIQQNEIFERNNKAASTLKSLTIVASITTFIPNIVLTIAYGTYSISQNLEVIPKEIFNVLSNLMFFNSIINAFVYWFHIKEFRSFYAKKIHSCFQR